MNSQAVSFGEKWEEVSSIHLELYVQAVNEIHLPLDKPKLDRLVEHSYNIAQVIRDFRDRYATAAAGFVRTKDFTNEIDQYEDQLYLLENIRISKDPLATLKEAVANFMDIFDIFRIMVK